MTLVLSMNPFCEHEGDAPLPQYQPIWESEHCSKSCVSSPSPPEGATEELAEAEPHCRRTPDHVTMSRIAYFKRKFVEDEEPHLSFRSYCQSVAPALEERAHVLRLSLEKMRFIDDPEAFLRRSVLINNLLRRIRTEILLQSEWCLPPGPAPTAAAACIPPPAQVGSNHPLGPQSLRPCFAAPGPYRKRFRLVRGEAPECIPACCCFYAAGRYLHFPFSVYEGAAPHPSSSPSSSSSSSSPTSFPQLLPVDDGDGDGEPHSLCPGLDLTEAAMAATAAARALDSKEPQRSRLRERTGAWEGERGHGGGTSEDRPLRERERERGRERDRERERARERGAGGGGGGDETLSGVAGSHARWSLDAMETGLHGALAWSQVGRK